MSTGRQPRWAGLLLVVGGVLWAIARFLISFDPPPLTYDDYNRLFTLPLLLVLAGWMGLQMPRLRRARWTFIVAVTVVTLGLVLMFVGNAVEFWGVLFQDKPNAFAAVETGDEAWAGSDIGWMIFGLGHFITALGALGTGLAESPGHGRLQQRLFLIAIAVLSFLWPVAAFAAWSDFAFAGLIGVCWAMLPLSPGPAAAPTLATKVSGNAEQISRGV